VSGAIPPPPNTSSWRGAEAQGQLYLYIAGHSHAIRDGTVNYTTFYDTNKVIH
jgi:hypothetical protein